MADAKSFALSAVSLLVAAIMIPMGMAIVVGTTTTTWNSAVVTLFQVLIPVLMIIGVALYFVKGTGGK